jgi:predicted RNase H-like HicB family nuclease
MPADSTPRATGAYAEGLGRTIYPANGRRAAPPAHESNGRPHEAGERCGACRRRAAACRKTSVSRTTGTAPEAMTSANTCPGPTEGSWLSASFDYRESGLVQYLFRDSPDQTQRALPVAANTDPNQINPFFTICADRCVGWQTPKKRVGAGVTSLFYGAWIARASDGTFVAELPDFPEITAVGVNQKQAAVLASIRLSAHVTALRQRGAALPEATGAAELLDGCIQRHGVAQFLEVREPSFRNVRG